MKLLQICYVVIMPKILIETFYHNFNEIKNF